MTNFALKDAARAVIGEFTLNLFGQDVLGPDYHDKRDAAVKMQISELMEKAGMSEANAEALVASGKGMPREHNIAPLMVLLNVPRDIKDEALKIQAAVRTIMVIEGKIRPDSFAKPNPEFMARDPEDLQQIQQALLDATSLDLTKPDTGPVKRIDILRYATDVLKASAESAAAKGHTHAEDAISSFLDAPDRFPLEQGPSTSYRPNFPKPNVSG